jgi:N-methylhydantoinase A
VASVFSAFGIAGSDAKRVIELSDPMRFPFDLPRIRRHFDRLKMSIVQQMTDQRLPIGEINLSCFVHLLFKGQVHTVRVPVTDFDLNAPDRGQGIVWRFVDLYENRFGVGTAYTQAGVEAVALSVEAIANLPKPSLARNRLGPQNARTAIKLKRPIYLHERKGVADVSVYAGDRLKPGHRIRGPALVEGEDMTVLIRTGHQLWVDAYANFRIDLRVKHAKRKKPKPVRRARQIPRRKK